MQKPTTFTIRQIFPALTLIGFLFLVFQSCQKSVEPTPVNEEIESRKRPKPPPPPPPPPPPFFFDNCSNPSFSGTFTAGVAANITVTLHYINSPGGSYPAFTSATVNGITVTAPAGTLNTGSGNIVFTASGTPPNTGIYTIPISIAGSYACSLQITALNPPNPGVNCTDPGEAEGSTGCITFMYRGQQVTYTTVRAADGKIWIQQNLGSPQVALHLKDTSSYGHYFQWGRWDDGHQSPSSPTITGGPTLQNPSHIPSGNQNFIKGSTNSNSWWGMGGSASNTWSGTVASSTNGKDPCVALGTGWRLPTAAEWQNIINTENILITEQAFQSNLKLTESGYRNSMDGMVFPNWVGLYYWSSTAGTGNNAMVQFIDDNYNFSAVPAPRGYGFACRCLKD